MGFILKLVRPHVYRRRCWYVMIECRSSFWRSSWLLQPALQLEQTSHQASGDVHQRPASIQDTSRPPSRPTESRRCDFLIHPTCKDRMSHRSSCSTWFVLRSPTKWDGTGADSTDGRERAKQTLEDIGGSDMYLGEKQLCLDR